MRKFFLVVSLAVSIAALLGGIAFATTLFGGVAHSDYVAPASRYSSFGTMQAQPGSFDPSGASPYNGLATFGQASPTFQAQPQPYVDWFMIPSWMAGTWSKKGDMTMSVTELRTGRTTNAQQWTDDEMTVSWGHQVDRAGHIWEANFVPSERDSISNGRHVRFMLVKCRCEHSAPEQVVTRMQYVVSESSGWGEGGDQFQQESINNYSPISANELQNYASTRVFSYEGSPLRNGIVLSKFTRVAPFHPIATDSGVDLRRSLADFLRMHQLAELIPDQGPGNATTGTTTNLPVVPEPF